MNSQRAKISLLDLRREPFRLFFVTGTLAALIGVLLWPLHLMGAAEFYPGVTHARLMTNGFFAAFIVGFLGTAFPRLISAPPLSIAELFALLAIQLTMVAFYIVGKIHIADWLFIFFFGVFVCGLFGRFLRRQDLPPPGFVMVGCGILCGMAGAILAVIKPDPETGYALVLLQKLLSYQGMVLLPILGVAGFLIPRFFGMPNKQEFPEMLNPSAAWRKKALAATAVVFVILASFALEAWGWPKLGPVIRFLAAGAYCFAELPLVNGAKNKNIFGMVIRVGFLFLLAGFIFQAFFPAYRVAILHTTLVGGFGLITFTVATRVLFGHSGNLALLKNANRWFLIAAALMTIGFLTRMSGDFWPQEMRSHYIYGAFLWIAGALVWAIKALPKVLIRDAED